MKQDTAFSAEPQLHPEYSAGSSRAAMTGKSRRLLTAKIAIRAVIQRVLASLTFHQQQPYLLPVEKTHPRQLFCGGSKALYWYCSSIFSIALQQTLVLGVL